MLRYAAAAALMLVMAGCSDSVTLVTQDQIAGFKPGSTNETEVQAALGKPSHTITEADGTKIDQYPYAEGASGGGGVVPDFLGGGSPQSYRMISFTYGAGGVLKDVSGK
jgi:hypothetical protein